jgi:hypothetical protein
MARQDSRTRRIGTSPRGTSVQGTRRASWGTHVRQPGHLGETRGFADRPRGRGALAYLSCVEVLTTVTAIHGRTTPQSSSSLPNDDWPDGADGSYRMAVSLYGPAMTLRLRCLQFPIAVRGTRSRAVHRPVIPAEGKLRRKNHTSGPAAPFVLSFLIRRRNLYAVG